MTSSNNPTVTAIRHDGAPTPVTLVPQCLLPEQAVGIRKVAEKRGEANPRTGTKGFALYSNPKTSNSGGDLDPLFQGWTSFQKMRADVPFTIGAHGGRFNRTVKQSKAGQFRDSFAYGEDIDPGVKALLTNPQFFEAAKRIHPEAQVIEPGILFANLFVPGEAQGIHTDVPEFRGCNRTNCPEWMLPTMHHSGLFKRWHVPIATGISWYSDHTGGELVFYQDPDKPGVPHPTPFNSAIVLDTDSVYHGVDAVNGLDAPPPVIPPDSLLTHKGNGRWCVMREKTGAVLDGYEDLSWKELRMSIQWKAYCFKDEAEQRAYHEHTDDITPALAWQTMVDELVRVGKATGTESVNRLIAGLTTHFIRVPRELQAPHEPQVSAHWPDRSRITTLESLESGPGGKNAALPAPPVDDGGGAAAPIAKL